MNLLLNNLFGWVLISGTIISYIPQYIKLYKYKTTIGISELMLIYGALSCLFNVIASIEVNREGISKCKDDCYNIFLPIVQLTIPWITGLIFYAMFIYYYKEYDRVRVIFNLYKFTAINLVVFLVTFIVNYFSNSFDTDETVSIVYSILSSIFCIIMWIPQIRTTIETREEGSLSLLSLFIHALGCLVTVIYQSLTNKSMFWVITSYIISFITEMGIVTICIYFKRIKKRKEVTFSILKGNE